MPVKRSAKREERKSATRRRRNDARRSAVRYWRRKVQKLTEAGQVDEARASLPQLQKAVDKAAARGVIHPNRAARMKARLAKSLDQS
ncbi:MAG TPA: 30S ribosomal protein S20 [Candidatus Bipolaricaulis anaerobius]|uniref:30S ribosomal protein S20 n=1 Tax=Candidatus Bipolaricaulis anaerobius TaxID=2026885 RepID=UPI000EFA52A2|nr:30S ribosomal protein S20 [Candidatus Bipolaricaulis anaerobius]MBP7726708.1 30S ribosomal protein S20 [Candidatus Bipolaricaulis sp.]MDD2912425.1 30S ribosomal protein S20 [Candidatus Bipolaricaulis anaerobius]MDD3748032.1 30S ribosomal protein S20 [Candidatus Bipolaricaulis anaerobius]MDD5764509.1 30S ribosomal protein S20 [Candidatus Bipolaricaulis anaerobius]HNR25052.1 30S ribosomal protein S20 [Candidatus Bipolaricaulis anaerobius]